MMIQLRVLPVRIKCGSEFQILFYVPVIDYGTMVYRSGEVPYLYHGSTLQTFI
jgi:hypothetical protein